MINQQALTSRQGRDQWHQKVLSTFCPMDINYPIAANDSFSCELLSTALDRIQLARIGSGAVDVLRTSRHIAHHSAAYYLVKFQLQGQGYIEHRGKEAYLNPGDFVVCTTSEPYHLRFANSYRQAVLAVPQTTLLELYGNADDILGERMDSSIPTHWLLSQFVQNIASTLDRLTPEVLSRLEANLLDLLITSLESVSLQLPGPSICSSTQEHLKTAKRQIGIHLRNPALSPDFIAAQAKISTRYLHMLFKEEGITVSRYILQQRLKACARALRQPELAQLSTTNIAHEWGFADVSHFHRCFKAHYQLTPRQYRQQHLA